MKFSIYFSESPTKSASLIVKRQLTKDDPASYQVYSKKHGKDCLLKVFPKTSLGKERYEREKLAAHLTHPNVARYIPTICKGDDYCLVTEYVRYDNFSQVLKAAGALKTEALVRTYFHQLIEGLEYIHSHGFAHLDLNLENLMIGSDYKLKIVNFGKSRLISTTTCNSIETIENCCSEGAFETNTTNLTAIDVFSAGQILFAFRIGKLPFFSSKDKQDDYSDNPESYSYFVTHNEEFWKKNTQSFLCSIKVSKEFTRLVNGMLNSNSEERLTINDIKSSEWYKGPVLNMKQVKSLMKPRIRDLEIAKAKSKKGSVWAIYLSLMSAYC